MARKVVGVGSVGTRAWIVLMLGRDGRDPLFLQLKEAQPSVLESSRGARLPQRRPSCGRPGSSPCRRPSDIFLGWNRFDEGVEA